MASQTLQYLKLDYQSQKDAMLQRIRDRWPQRWNDFLANSFGIVLVDIVAWALATLAFTVNRVAGENFIPTMTLRESAVRVGALTGYELRGPVPATLSCEAAISTAFDRSTGPDVVIAQGTLIRSSDTSALPYEVVQDYTIMHGYVTPRTLVAVFSPILSGTNVINTFMVLTNGSSLATPVDSTIDLSAYLSVGQDLIQIGVDDTVESNYYNITNLNAAPGAVSAYSQIVLNTPWAGTTGRYQVNVYERRIQVIQGQTVTDQFVAPINTTGYSVMLSQTPVIFGSIQVTVNGEPWTQAPTIGILNDLATVFQAKTYVTGDTSVQFGDGIFGALVPSEAAISVTYRVGGGSAGNIGLNTISTTITGLVETISSPITVQVTNTTSVGQGGQDAETLNQARVNIPYYTRTNDRAVTLDDYQTIAQQYSNAQYGSVAYARSTVRTENALLEGNIVSIYAWTTGPGGGLIPLGGQLKGAVRDYMQTKAVGTDYVQMLDGTSRPVPISLQFAVLPGFSISDIKSLVVQTIASQITALRPGDPVIYSDLVSALVNTAGVDNLVMATPINNLYPADATELFTVPDDTYVYTLDTSSAGAVTAADGAASQYSVQLPMYPLQPWSLTLMLGVNSLSLLPFLSQDSSGRVQVQQARVVGANISTDDSYPSTINLLTGQATFYVLGAPGDLTMELVTAVGYSAERVVNLYIGYQGDLSQAARRQIRSALLSWGQGFGVGSSIYAARATGISASVVSVSDMVASIPGVTSVNRVALDTPANTDNLVTAADYELLRLGTVVLNNQLD